MSDFSQGIGWWRASDGKWYPPDQPPPKADAPEPDNPCSDEGGPPRPPRTFSEARVIPELATAEEEHSHHHRRLTDPLVLLVCALLLIAIGAGSATAISFATRNSAETSAKTTAPPTSRAATSPSTISSPSANSSTVPPTTSSTSSTGTSSPSGPAPATVIGPPGDPVNEAVTNEVLTTTWTGYMQAMIANDRTAVTQYTTPLAFEVSVGLLDCGCLPEMTYASSTITVPPATSYPLSFLAGLHSSGYDEQGQTWWVVFTKAGAATPWIIAFVAGNTGGTGIDGHDPYALKTPPTEPNPIDQDPQAYASFFQKLDTTGKVGNGLPKNYGQTPIIDQFVESTSSLYEFRRASRVREQVRHRIDEVSPVFAFVNNGTAVAAIECFAINLKEAFAATAGFPISQPPDRSEWTHLLQPGSYKSLSYSDEEDNCVVEDPDGLSYLFANQGGVYSMSATPA